MHLPGDPPTPLPHFRITKPNAQKEGRGGWYPPNFGCTTAQVRELQPLCGLALVRFRSLLLHFFEELTDFLNRWEQSLIFRQCISKNYASGPPWSRLFVHGIEKSPFNTFFYATLGGRAIDPDHCCYFFNGGAGVR